MGLEIEKTKPKEDAVSELVTIDRHLYLTEDGTRVVEEGDPDAWWLWAAPGDEKPAEEAERLGAVKRRSRPKDKARPKPEDKGAGQDDAGAPDDQGAEAAGGTDADAQGAEEKPQKPRGK